MNTRLVAVRAGAQRGRIEFRQNMTSAQDVWSVMFTPVISIVVMYVLKDNTVPGMDFSLGTQAIPGILAMNLVLTGLMQLALALTTERQDGTLLRAKATPHGVLGYLIGKLVSTASITVMGLLIALVPAALLFDGLQLGVVTSWLTLAWVLALGLIATLPLGAIVGAVFPNAQSMSIVTLPMMMLFVISGVFYPITGFPEWLQGIAQIFPVYWLGLGLRSTLLPEALSAAEVGGSWRHLETVGVLGAWAVVGLAVAPVVLRRMARRESGSSMTARRKQALPNPT